MAVQLHLIVDAVLGGNPTTITIRPSPGKIGKFWYAKTSVSADLIFNGESGTKALSTPNAFEWGEAIFGEGTNYQKFELILDYNNYITIVNSIAPAGTYSVYWCET